VSGLVGFWYGDGESLLPGDKEVSELQASIQDWEKERSYDVSSLM